MNWHQGNIVDAVALSKAKNAIFVVFVEGKNEDSKRLAEVLDSQRVRAKLESEDFVAIKLSSDTEAYMQFASIYQVVPVPSIFFIGKSGVPLHIGTSAIAGVDELDKKIDELLQTNGKQPRTSSAALIAAEQSGAAATSTAQPQTAPATATATSSAAQPEEVVVCEDGVCFKKPKDVQTGKEEETEDSEARLEHVRKLLEEKRRKAVEEEKKLEKERELRRRREGKEVQNLQQWQKEQELKELKDNIRRERMEEQAARERIRAQIAADRAERAMKFSAETDAVTSAAIPRADVPQAQQPNNNNIPSSTTTRLQIRLPNGTAQNRTFEREDTLSVVRDFVKSELLPGTGIRDFILATTYPKREFNADDDTQSLQQLGLSPSAVILVISADNSNSIISSTGGLFGMLSRIIWSMLSPIFAAFNYLKNRVTPGRGNNADGATVGSQKRARDANDSPHDAAKRRNLDRLSTEASTSHDATAPNAEEKPYRRYGGSNVHRLNDHKDSDDENATWNGNSTQQQ